MSKNQKNGKNKYCMYSNKRTANREVILVKYAVDYLKAQGYIILGDPLCEVKK